MNLYDAIEVDRIYVSKSGQSDENLVITFKAHNDVYNIGFYTWGVEVINNKIIMRKNGTTIWSI